MSNGNKIHPLIGKTIVQVARTTDKYALRFTLSDGSNVVARADGECCSVSWIEHVSLPARGLPATVLEALDVHMPLTLDSEDSCLKHYGFELKTDKGPLFIDYRNESNGYYGGELVWPGDVYYGGVFNQNNDNGEWRNIVEDV